MSTISRTTIIVSITLLTLLICAGCYPSTSMKEDIGNPVDMKKVGYPTPTYPISSYRMQLAKDTMPLKRHGLQLSNLSAAIKKCERPATCEAGTWEDAARTMSELAKEVRKVENTVRQLTPPDSLEESFMKTIILMQAYKGVLDEGAAGDPNAVKKARTAYDRLIDHLRSEKI